MYTMKEIRRAIRRDRDLKGTIVKTKRKDAILLDVTDDRQPDIAILDLTGDGNVDSIALDLDGNGYFDTLLADTDKNDIPDTVIRGNLDLGIINEIISGSDVEDAIIDLENLIVSAAILGVYAVSAAQALSEEIDTRISEAAAVLEEAEKAEAKAQKKAEIEAKRIQRSEERKQKMEELRAKVGKLVKRN